MSSFIKGLAVLFMRAVSAFFRCLGWRACRFHPSCSHYSEEAFRQFGFFRAAKLTVSRVLKCHPFHTGGYDPLPGNSGR